MPAAYQKGARVKHEKKSDWGLGEVVSDSVNNHVEVIFEDAGYKKFSVENAPFLRVSGEEAKSDSLGEQVKRHLKKSGKGKNAPKDKECITFPEAVDKFLHHFREGFLDPKFEEEERGYKRKAHERIKSQLGAEKLREWNSNGQYEAVFEQAKKLMGATNLISPYEIIWLKNGLNTAGRVQLFAETLQQLLYGEGSAQERFEAFTQMLYTAEAAKWPIATYFQFLAFPDKHIFLKPTVTKQIAEVMHLDIDYHPQLSWSTYSKVQVLAEKLDQKLKQRNSPNLIPRDLIDIQSFIWVVGAYD